MPEGKGEQVWGREQQDRDGRWPCLGAAPCGALCALKLPDLLT